MVLGRYSIVLGTKYSVLSTKDQLLEAVENRG